MFFLKKSQASLEYIIMFGLAFLLIIGLFSVFMNNLTDSTTSISKEQITKIGNTFISNIEQVYYMGSGSRTTLNTNFPNNINNLYVWHSPKVDVIVFNYSMSNGNDYVEYFNPNDLNVKFNLSSGISYTVDNRTYFNEYRHYSSGHKNIRFISRDDFVEICFFTYNASTC